MPGSAESPGKRQRALRGSEPNFGRRTVEETGTAAPRGVGLRPQKHGRHLAGTHVAERFAPLGNVHPGAVPVRHEDCQTRGLSNTVPLKCGAIEIIGGVPVSTGCKRFRLRAVVGRLATLKVDQASIAEAQFSLAA